MKKSRSCKYIVGIDEVGRGPLAGPVTVCAFAILTKDLKLLDSIHPKDSKMLSEKKREIISQSLKQLATQKKCHYAIASVSSKIIDSKGLTYAITSAVHKALETLDMNPKQAMIYLDGGLHAPEIYVHQETVIKGDATVPVISCASILAKVSRDHVMKKYDKQFPHYGFGKHKGYGTAEHYRAIHKEGITSIHRLRFLKNL
jgi:ribonuclease HII